LTLEVIRRYAATGYKQKMRCSYRNTARVVSDSWASLFKNNPITHTAMLLDNNCADLGNVAPYVSEIKHTKLAQSRQTACSSELSGTIERE